MVIWCAFALAGVFDTLFFSFINIQFRSLQNTDLETMGPKVWTCLFVFLAFRSLGLCSVLMVISQGEIFYWIQIKCLIGVCGLKRRKSRPKWCWGPTLAKILSTVKHITQLYPFPVDEHDYRRITCWLNLTILIYITHLDSLET